MNSTVYNNKFCLPKSTNADKKKKKTTTKENATLKTWTQDSSESKRPLYKNTKPLIKEKKNAIPKTQTVFPDQNSDTLTCDSSLQLHIHTDRTSVLQPIKQTNKENPKGSKKEEVKTENLCSFSATVKTENLCSSFATTGDLEAIPSLLFNNRQFRR